MEVEQAEAIATEWGVSVDLLKQTEWTVESIDGNDGQHYGYFVRFSDNTDPDLLSQLGVSPGEFYRQTSVNVFDEPEPEEPLYSDDRLERAGRDPAEWANIMSDYARNDGPENRSGAAFVGSAFVGDAFAVADTASVHLTARDGVYLTDSQGNRLTAATTVRRRPRQPRRTEQFQRELLLRLDRLEAALQTYSHHLPARYHNAPPELVEPDPIPPTEYQQVLEATVELRIEIKQEQPDPAKIEAQASVFRKAAGSILAWLARKADSAVEGVIQWGAPLGVAYAVANPKEVYDALLSAAEIAASFAAHLQSVWS